MKFKVEIREMNTPKIKGFLFSILHPTTGEPIYEFHNAFQEIGKRVCEEIIADINKGLEERD